MDQDSFRRLLQTPRPSGSSTLGALGSRAPFIAATKKKTVDASQPTFKPRNVKKVQESKYRDRASERRVGDGNDYAHIEAVLEDFEKRNADVEDKDKVEAQRKYLGGDGEHSILVKGLDFALLEQNKARSAITNDDLDALDQAYLESSSQPTTKKRTREDLIRELKEHRARKPGQSTPTSKTAEEKARVLEEARQKGKFKPIGFQPIGQSSDTKKKNTKSDATGAGKKKRKKRKVDEDTVDKTNLTPSTSMPPPLTGMPAEPEVPVNDDFDIFAGAGEYEGIDIGDDDDEGIDGQPEGNGQAELEEGEEPSSSSSAVRRWIESDELLPVTRPKIPLPSMQPGRLMSNTSSPQERAISDDEDAEHNRPMRLAPLASSALPSIKDFLAMDKAAGSHDKKRKRKDKKGGGGDDEDDDSKKKNIEAKVDRDYKRLKSFTDKKAASSK